MDVEGAVTAGTWLRLNNSTTGGNNWNLISSGSGNGEGAGKLIFNDQTGGSIGDVMVLDPAGKVGVAQVPATNALEVNGNASKTTAGSWLANSDRRIKLDIRTIDHALETLDRVRLVDFRYTPEYRAMHPSLVDRRYLNVIAQELAAIYHPSCNEQHYDRAWRDEWIGEYTAPTTGPLTTGRDPDAPGQPARRPES